MKAWIVASLVALMIVSAVNVVAVARRVPPPARAPRPSDNVVLQHEQRFAAIRRALAVRVPQGVIGYVTDLPPDRIAADAGAMQEYFLTQFALAPWILDARAEGLAWVVANLHAAAVTARIPPGFSVAEDFGDGVLLLTKEPR